MFVFRKEELKEDKNEAKIGAEWRLIRHKDSSSFYLTFIVFKWTLVLLGIDILICLKVKKSFWHAFLNTTESKACNKETCNSAVRSINYIIRELKLTLGWT